MASKLFLMSSDIDYRIRLADFSVTLSTLNRCILTGIIKYTKEKPGVESWLDR